MSAADPLDTTVGDLCNQALKDSGYLGIGQTALAEDMNDALIRMQWMIQEWERKRWMVYHLVNLAKLSTGVLSYTVGPGGDFDTGVDSVRPARIESAFLRNLQNSQPNNIDYPLEILQSREDYDKIALKSLVSFPAAIFMDTDWPRANLYCYPVAQASIYEIHISIMAQLQSNFLSDLTTVIDLPFEYYTTIVSNLAMRMRARFQIGTFPGDNLPMLAKSSLNTIRGANTQIARLQLPNLGRKSQYNIFSDREY